MYFCNFRCKRGQRDCKIPHNTLGNSNLETRIRDNYRNVVYIMYRPQTKESVKLSMYLHHAIKAYGEVNVQVHSF